jgi:hypothetical protein
MQEGELEKIEFDGPLFKVVQVGLSSRTKAWRRISELVSTGYHVVGVVGNNGGMGLGWVMLEKDI